MEDFICPWNIKLMTVLMKFPLKLNTFKSMQVLLDFYICICACMYVCMCVLHIYIYIYIYVCMYVVCMYVLMYVCVYVCMHVCIMYVYTMYVWHVCMSIFLGRTWYQKDLNVSETKWRFAPPNNMKILLTCVPAKIPRSHVTTPQ